jgi:hypothetical protein
LQLKFKSPELVILDDDNKFEHDGIVLLDKVDSSENKIKKISFYKN